MYIVISNPKRKSIAVGVVHIVFLLKLISTADWDQFTKDVKQGLV